MSDYKRLTNNNLEEYDPEYDFCIACKYFGEPNGCNRPNGTCDNYERFIETYNRLAELEDKLESGRLVELPCKVNSTVYIVYDLRVIESKVRTIFFGSNGAEMIRTQHYDIPFRNWGKTLFLTREEAEEEKRLKELQEKQK